MSDLTNKAAYLQGLAEGMKLDTETNEGKLISELINLVGDMTAELSAIDEEQGFLADKLDDLDEEVDVLGEEVFSDYDDDEYDDEYDDDDSFQIKCQACGADIVLSSEDIMDGAINCPSCGAEIEFDFDECEGDCENCSEDK